MSNIPTRKYEYVIIRNDNEIGINEYGFDYLIKLEKALDEIREYIKANYLFNYVYDEEELFEITSDRKAKEDLLQILDKVKE